MANEKDTHITWLMECLKEWDMTFDEDTEIPELVAKIEHRAGMISDELDTLIFHLWQMARGELLKIE